MQMQIEKSFKGGNEVLKVGGVLSQGLVVQISAKYATADNY